MITLTENCFTCRKKLEKKCTFRCITCNQNVCENCGSFNSFDHNEVIDWICLTCQSKEKNDCLPRKLKNKEQISPRCNIYSNKNNVKYNHFMDRKSVLKRQQSLPINVKSKIFQRTRDVKSDITQPKIENEIIDAIFKKCDVNDLIYETDLETRMNLNTKKSKNIEMTRKSVKLEKSEKNDKKKKNVTFEKDISVMGSLNNEKLHASKKLEKINYTDNPMKCNKEKTNYSYLNGIIEKIETPENEKNNIIKTIKLINNLNYKKCETKIEENEEIFTNTASYDTEKLIMMNNQTNRTLPQLTTSILAKHRISANKKRNEPLKPIIKDKNFNFESRQICNTKLYQESQEQTKIALNLMKMLSSKRLYNVYGNYVPLETKLYKTRLNEEIKMKCAIKRLYLEELEYLHSIESKMKMYNNNEYNLSPSLTNSIDSNMSNLNSSKIGNNLNVFESGDNFFKSSHDLMLNQNFSKPNYFDNAIDTSFLMDSQTIFQKQIDNNKTCLMNFNSSSSTHSIKSNLTNHDGMSRIGNDYKYDNDNNLLDNPNLTVNDEKSIGFYENIKKPNVHLKRIMLPYISEKFIEWGLAFNDSTVGVVNFEKNIKKLHLKQYFQSFGIEEGDFVLEYNGQNLLNIDKEPFETIINQPSDEIDLVLYKRKFIENFNINSKPTDFNQKFVTHEISQYVSMPVKNEDDELFDMCSLN